MSYPQPAQPRMVWHRVIKLAPNAHISCFFLHLNTNSSNQDSKSVMSSSPTTHGMATPSTEAEWMANGSPITTWLKVSRVIADNSTHDPVPGDTLLIVDKIHGRVLTCRQGGNLSLERISDRDMQQPIPERWQWLCSEKDNFTGFLNVAERRFLGRNMRWNYIAQAGEQQGFENFVLNRRQNGYRILSPDWFSLYPMSARFDGTRIDAHQSDGTLWGFVQVV